MGIEIAILTLIVCAILLLVAIFTVLMLKNKKKTNENIVDVVEKLNDIQREQIVADMSTKYNEANKSMLEENSRNNISLNTNLTTTINTNNQTINKTIEDFREAQNKKFDTLMEKLENRLSDIQKEMSNSLSSQKLANADSNRQISEAMTSKLNAIEKEITKQFNDMKADNSKNNNDIKEMLVKKFDEIDKGIANELDKLRTENQTKLDQMREVVDTKMQETLNTRINDSFKLISEQLQAVSKGLGEVSNLTNDVNNLNKIMSNVKTRGTWGEISLQNILEQIFTEDQYLAQTKIKGNDRVDFAILLPGKKDEERIYLPIDAKFPTEDYQRMVEANDKDEIESARKSLFRRIKDEAKSISTKYINVPMTTNFAIMYLPIEGLYAEVVRDSTLLDELQNKYNIVISGPTTITALLNSLQLGFRTLQIQKNSKEVWNALAKFRTEFQNFNLALKKVKDNANKVVTSIDDTTKKTEKIEKVLNKLGTIEYNSDDVDLIGGANADSDN